MHPMPTRSSLNFISLHCTSLKNTSCVFFTQIKAGVHLHVRKCVHVFRISGKAERNTLNFGMWAGGSTECVMLEYGVLLDPLAMHFT